MSVSFIFLPELAFLSLFSPFSLPCFPLSLLALRILPSEKWFFRFKHFNWLKSIQAPDAELGVRGLVYTGYPLYFNLFSFLPFVPTAKKEAAPTGAASLYKVQDQ